MATSTSTIEIKNVRITAAVTIYCSLESLSVRTYGVEIGVCIVLMARQPRKDTLPPLQMRPIFKGLRVKSPCWRSARSPSGSVDSVSSHCIGELPVASHQGET